MFFASSSILINPFQHERVWPSFLHLLPLQFHLSVILNSLIVRSNTRFGSCGSHPTRSASVVQDVISKGHRGTRVQCLKQAASAVSKGSSILIDRCNIDVDQRRDFLELAKERGIQAHALVLNFPSSVCIQRATQRTEHEGGLLGPDVGRVVNHVYRSRQLPTLLEGFSHITYCRTDAEVEKAVTLYSQLHTEDHLPFGIFGSTVYEGKGTLQFSATAARDDEREVGVRTQQVQQTNAQESQASPGIKPGESSIANKSQDLAVEKEEKSTLGILFDSDSCEGKKTLAFPSISTSDFQFDHEKAADIIVKAAIQFFQDKDHAGLRLIFVDLSPNSDMLARVRRNLVKEGLNPQQLLTHAGDITKLRSSGGLACNMITNAANWCVCILIISQIPKHMQACMRIIYVYVNSSGDCSS